jgi:hypothetical protein
MTYMFYTGPCTVDQVAEDLTKRGFFNVRAGTETVYFSLTPGYHPDTLEEAQDRIDNCYPSAHYKV